MRLRATIRRLAPLLVVPFLLTLGGGPVQALFRCEHDLVVRRACCCPKMHQAQEAPAGPTVAAACCCSIETVRGTPAGEARAQSERFDGGQALVAIAALAPATDVAPAPLVARAGAVSPRPPDPRSLLGQKTSFLR